MNIILLGPQGSGKGTQATLLAQYFEFCTVSVGELLRHEACKKTTRGKLIKETLAKGDLVPTTISLQLLQEYIEKNAFKKGIILDGFPRTLDQAEALDEMMNIDTVIELFISDEQAIKRLSGRLQCKQGHIYGTDIPPKKKGICDIDKEKLLPREDDTPKAIKERLLIYHDETEPLLEYYRPRNVLCTVDASKSPQEVFKDVCKLFLDFGFASHEKLLK